MSQRTQTLQRLLILSQQLDSASEILEFTTNLIEKEENQSRKTYLWNKMRDQKTKRDELENELTLLSMEFNRSNPIVCHSDYER